MTIYWIKDTVHALRITNCSKHIKSKRNAFEYLLEMIYEMKLCCNINIGRPLRPGDNYLATCWIILIAYFPSKIKSLKISVFTPWIKVLQHYSGINMHENVRVQNVSNLEQFRNTKITNVRGNKFSKQDDCRLFLLICYLIGCSNKNYKMSYWTFETLICCIYTHLAVG